MSIYNQSTGTSVAKHIPITRTMRHIVASRHLQSIETCPHSISYGIYLPNLTSFTLFGNLPPEVRAQVWAFALLEPHMVELEFSPVMDTISSPQSPLPPSTFRNKTPHPLLSTCIESREEVFKRYRSSRHLRCNPLPISFAIDSLFITDLHFGSVQSYWSPTADLVRRGGHRMPLLSIFEGVESLVISRKSILSASCEAESIIRRCFPNLCLLIVSMDLHSWGGTSSDYPARILLHPEDDCHVSVLASALSACHWDTISASRVKINMQRRFGRQERIHRGYIAPIVKVASACKCLNNGGMEGCFI